MHVDPRIEHDHRATHAITEEVEAKLKEALGRVTATIHVEPLPPDQLA